LLSRICAEKSMTAGCPVAQPINALLIEQICPATGGGARYSVQVMIHPANDYVDFCVLVFCVKNIIADAVVACICGISPQCCVFGLAPCHRTFGQFADATDATDAALHGFFPLAENCRIRVLWLHRTRITRRVRPFMAIVISNSHATQSTVQPVASSCARKQWVRRVPALRIGCGAADRISVVDHMGMSARGGDRSWKEAGKPAQRECRLGRGRLM